MTIGSAYHVEWPDGACDAAFCHGEPSVREYGPITTDGMAAGIVHRQGDARLLFVINGTVVAADGLEVQLTGGSGSVAGEFSGTTLALWLDGESEPVRVGVPSVTKATVNGAAATVEREGEYLVIRARPQQ
jgi:hypothetical protein